MRAFQDIIIEINQIQSVCHCYHSSQNSNFQQEKSGRLSGSKSLQLLIEEGIVKTSQQAKGSFSKGNKDFITFQEEIDNQ